MGPIESFSRCIQYIISASGSSDVDDFILFVTHHETCSFDGGYELIIMIMIILYTKYF